MEVEEGRRRSEYADNDALGRKADYGLKRRMAAIRFFAIVGLVAIVALVVVMWLLGQALALASLPAVLIVAALILAALIAVTAEGRNRWLALTPLAFAIGLLPHAVFLIVYNLAADLGGHGDASYLPTLWAPFDVYEDAVLRLQERTQTWFQGPRLIVCVLVCCAVIAGFALTSLRAAQMKRRARIAVGLAQAFVLGLITTTIFSQVTIGQWSPSLYASRLDSDLAWLDQTRTQTLLLEEMTRSVRANAPAIRGAYEPTIRSAIEALRSRQSGNSVAAADQLGWDYAAAVGQAAKTGTDIDRVNPGPPADLPRPFADRPAVLAAEREAALEKGRFDTALAALAGATADTFAGLPADSPAAVAFVDTFAAGLIDITFEQLAARFDRTFGDGLAGRLRQADSTPEHPLTRAVAARLDPALLPEDQRRFSPAGIGQTLAEEQVGDVSPDSAIEASIDERVRQAMSHRAGAS